MSRLSFVIRDGLPTDIAGCMTLDTSYDTEFVWQMTVQEMADGQSVAFRRDRLPRRMTVDYPASEKRIKSALETRGCFIVATARDEPETLGYLVMRHDPIHRIAHLHDLVVSLPYRRHQIGTRLLNIARRWADEHNLNQFIAETQTKNYPAITFLQHNGLRFCGYNDQYFPNQDIAVFFGQALR